jgi:FK506-binding protein 2
MKPFHWLSLLAFGVLVSAQPTELEIETTFTPTDCSVKAQKGDAINVHYVRQISARLSVDPRN